MRGVRPGRLVLHATCVVVGIWLVLPTLVAIPVSFTPVRSFAIPDETWSGRWYVNFFTDPRWLEAVRNSAIIASISAVVATVAGTCAALALDRARNRGRSVFAALLLTPAIVPIVLLALGLYYVFLRWQLVGTVIGLVIAHSVTALPLVVQPVLASLARHDRRLEDAARSLGAGPATALWQVTLPLIRPGVLAGAVFAFIWSFDEIVISIFLTSPELQTLPVLMFNAVTQVLDPTIAAASSLVLVFTTVLILFGLRIGGKEVATRAL